MAHEIILPMLGMAQDTGIIVSWQKQVGDAVKANDILMEVETDKSTVEVEVGHDGYLVALKAETGVAIPVGQVVAIVSEDQNDIEAQSAAPSSPPSEVKEEAAPVVESPPAEAEPAPVAAEEPAPPVARQTQQSSTGRILASPKARREAKERGIDLRRLVRLGIPQPFHVGDLDKAGSAASGGSEASFMRVVIEKAPFADFCAWLNEEADDAIASLNIWSAFAAGSLRKVTETGKDNDIVVYASGFSDEVEVQALRNPDRSNLSSLTGETGSGEATITILDLSDTPLAEYRPAGGTALPHLTIANSQDGAYLDLALAFDPDILADAIAFNFLKDLAERAQQPLRHLV